MALLALATACISQHCKPAQALEKCEKSRVFGRDSAKGPSISRLNLHTSSRISAKSASSGRECACHVLGEGNVPSVSVVSIGGIRWCPIHHALMVLLGGEMGGRGDRISCGSRCLRDNPPIGINKHAASAAHLDWLITGLCPGIDC